MELRAHSHEKQSKEIDEMISLVSEKAGGKCKEIIITLWYDVTKREGGYKTRYRADIYYKPIDSKEYLRFNFG